MIPQANSSACGPTAAWNAAVLLLGKSVFTLKNEYIYAKLASDSIASKGTNLRETAAAFNQFAEGSSYHASVIYGNDVDDVIDRAVNSGASVLIGATTNSAGRHAQVYYPDGGGQFIVYSSTQTGVISFSSDAISMTSDTYRAGKTYGMLIIK
jgi:hypothetical protein